MSIRKLTNYFFISALLFGSAMPVMGGDELFPRPAAIEPDVQFWIKVFTEASTSQGFIHDDKHLGVIYEKINVPQGVKRKAKQNYIKQRKKRYEQILKKLANGATNLTKEEQRVLNLWPKGVNRKSLYSATKRIRFQLGQSNKYLAGLKRSGAWRDHIIKTLDDMGLPREIASLPHVESSFNPKAYSKVGAAGLWQFTRSTGRRFMRVDHVVDERMDPFKASVAAARLLENNYSVIGTWPLALTAYNHGAAGMRRAARVTGTTDITTILRTYRSRSFKFASRNFYVAFLAAVDVEKNAEKHFGKVEKDPPIIDKLVKVPGYMSVKDISRSLGLSVSYLRGKNPGLRPLVWRNQKYVPKGYELRIGKNKLKKSAKALSANLAASKMFARQKRDLYHRVRRGQTLSQIASRYRVRIRDLMAVNNLRSRHRIRVGQRLRLPSRGGAATTMVASVSDTLRDIPDNGLHKVRRGDTIQKIAKSYKLKTRDILAYNNLSSRSRIYPGQRLRLKPYPKAATTVVASSGPYETYRVQRGDTLEKIARKYNINIGEIQTANNIGRRGTIFPGQKLKVAVSGEFVTHKVKRGDTLEKIAKVNKVKIRDIRAFNNLSKRSKIYPGQKLKLKPITVATTLASAQTGTSDAPVQLAMAETNAAAPSPEQSAETAIQDTEQAAETQEAARDNSNAEESGSQENDDSVSSQQTPDDTEQQLAESNQQNSEELSSGAIGAEAQETLAETVVVVSDTETPDDTSINVSSDVDQLDDKTVAKVGDLEAVEQPSSPSLDEVLDHQLTEIEQNGVPVPEEATLLADPTNYGVLRNSMIVVQAAETLGHYADWLQVSAMSLRRLNKMRFGKPVVIGKRLKLTFKKVDKEIFVKRRKEYHQGLQEEFFKNFEIAGADKHTIRRGDSVWLLAKRKYKIPIWLLRQYNPDLELNRILPGTVVKFPKIVEKSEDVSKITETVAEMAMTMKISDGDATKILVTP